MRQLPTLLLASSLTAFAVALMLASCAGSDTEPMPPVPVGGWATTTTTASAGFGGAGGGAGGGTGGNPSCPSAGGGGAAGDLVCPTRFEFRPEGIVMNPRVAGEWNGFALASATEMDGPDSNGTYSATIDLPPGLHAYKFVYDASGETYWVFDPGQARRKYVGGTENSAMLVGDCRRPKLEVADTSVSRPSSGNGSFQASLSYVDSIAASGADPACYSAVLQHEGESRALGSSELTVSPSGDVSVALGSLEDGKYRVVLRAQSTDGWASEPARLVFWVEQEPFSWQDAIIYMVVTDRYLNGDPSNDPAATAGADPRGDWKGGDLEGLRQSIEDGVLDQLGVRAIWLTPFNTNPTGAFMASDGIHQVTGYHGYWPTRAREVDPRIGGPEALRALVTTAHQHGIRILQDFVINHVHVEHEYVSAHPEWFRQGCVCGTANCDWTGHALDCMFASYLPDVDHSVTEANQAFVADAVWWLDEFDLDGLRVDAVKHVEEAATRNVAAAVREGFELAGTRYFLMGETAMGWSDGMTCSDQNYQTISRYIGPFGLDGQFDFVLYHGVSYRTFAYDWTGMIHADYWANYGQSCWPEGAIMTPYVGSHDTPRFVSLADYRGQDGAHPVGVPGNQWDNTAIAPTDSEPYRRMRIAMTWLLTLPGAPLLYYGDEYGQWGGADPNNRLMWRDETGLNADEAATLAWTRALGTARRDNEALRRGAYVSLGAATTESTLVFARQVPNGPVAIVGLTRSLTAEPVTASVSSLGLADGTVLQDALGGPSATVSGGNLSFTVPASSGVILAP